MSFADYWTTYAQRYGGGREKYKTFDLIEAEWANLDAAAEWLWQMAKAQSAEVRDKNVVSVLYKLVTALASSSGPLFTIGLWGESLKLSSRIYELASTLDDWKEAGVRAFEMAWIQHFRAKTDEAAMWADRCAEAWARDGSKQQQANAIRIRGLVAHQRKNYNEAERLFQDALTIHRASNNYWMVVVLLVDLSKLKRDCKHYDEAAQSLSEALQLAEKFDQKANIASLHGHLGRLAIVRNQWSEAKEQYEKALPLASETGRQDMIADTQNGLALVYEQEGQYSQALTLAQESLAIHEKLRSSGLLNARRLVERLKKNLDEQESPPR
jgi:tetratricopeptide (TPR) repeat protein